MNITTRHWNARQAMLVRRYHQHALVENDTIGKHSCGVAALVMLLDPGCRKEVLMHAICHDFGEFATGDLPAPAKRALSPMFQEEFKALERHALWSIGWPEIELTDDETQLFKACDYLDGLTYCIEEVERGNRALRNVGETYSRYIPAYLDSPNDWCRAARELFTNLHNKWKELQ